MPTYDVQLVAAPMPTLENLKKQAKQYLRWHRERYYPVAVRVRSLLPRFQHLSDSEVLEASFKLSDAQELVARENGFDGWRALKTGTQIMTTETKSCLDYCTRFDNGAVVCYRRQGIEPLFHH